ncbi:hypothetical protein MLC59_18520 [Marinobacter bryozoorum]|uniref:hypothetical protein n=1 Tax=Marinobacter bryozoorum TaxID=256324 RepID=UPI0020065886|nr:hypothetical protein [Marinobacter bryozoorum]MCK7546156.1 hypothetical protein [Marinobacter bryozoorum]
MEKPLIPKRFATRIRMAQEKVTDACKNIVNDDIANAQDLDRIAEFEADSKAFARKYYGNKTADSYPVQTNISRCRENILRSSKVSEHDV